MRIKQIFCAFLKNHRAKVSPEVNTFCTTTNRIAVGDTVSVTKAITQEDVLNFAKLTGDYNPIHVELPRNIVHGALLNGLVSGVIGTKLPGPGTIVVQETLVFPKPCYVGDVIETKIEITSVRKIIKCQFTCTANGDKVVLKGDAKLMR